MVVLPSEPVTARIRGEDIPGFAAEEYAVYEHFSGSCRVLKWGESFEITLRDENDYRLYIFAPVVDGEAVLGWTEKYISPKTIGVKDVPCTYVRDGRLYTRQK